MMLSRRNLLAGSTLALGCSERAALVEPQLVGQSPDRGHLLRSAELLDAAIDVHERVGAVIVGGGVAGFSAAWRLVKAGFTDFVLLELEPEVGGTARTGSLPRSPHPMGAHYLPTPPRECVELLDLLRDLGVVVGHRHDGTPEFRSTDICAGPSERHYFNSAWHPGLYPSDGETAEEAAQWQRFWDLLLELDGARDETGELLFRLPVRRSAGRLRHLDELSMAAWLDEHDFTSWRLRWYVDYACRDDYGCSLEQTSAFAALHHFLGRGLEQTRDGALLTWAGGNGELIAAMKTFLGANLRLHRDHLVYAIDPDSGRVRARDLAGERTIEFATQAVLWAAPRFLLRHVLPRDRDPLPATALTYAPWLVANLELDRRPSGVGETLAWDNVPIHREPHARNLGYVVATHQESRDRAHEPGCVITYYEPLVADDLARARAQLLAGDARSLAEQTLRALEHMHPGIRRWLTAMHVHRWGHAMIRPVPGLLFGGALELARAPIGCVRGCATDVGGLPLFEEAFYAAIEAADWALDRLGSR